MSDSSRYFIARLKDRQELRQAYAVLVESDLPADVCATARRACIRSEITNDDWLASELAFLGGMGAAW